MKFTCTKCPMRAACMSPCAAVQALLPAEERARIHRLRRRKAYHRAEQLLAQIDDSRFLTDNRHRLQGRLRQVFDLVYNEGMSHAEIARLLGLHRRSISHLLESARRVIVRRTRGKR